jgi:4-hydroxybenzoate polyprenyltransferase
MAYTHLKPRNQSYVFNIIIYPIKALPMQPSHVLYHLYTVWLFVRNDIYNTAVVAIIFGLANASIAHKYYDCEYIPPLSILSQLPSMTIWSFCLLLAFNMHNQLRGVAEDALNKSWRPLPAGRISEKQTANILYGFYPITAIISLWIGGFYPALLMLSACIWYNEFGGDSHPLLKNFLNAFGITCFLAGPLEIVLQHSVLTFNFRLVMWLTIILTTITITSHVQDLRDIAGDSLSGRRTVPISIGEMEARVLAALGSVALTYLACWFWEADYKGSALASVLSLALSKTLLLSRDQISNDFVWKKLWHSWMLSLFCIPLFKGFGY